MNFGLGLNTLSEAVLNTSAILSYIFMQSGILKHWQLSNKNIDQLWDALMIIYIISIKYWGKF